jgi:hypothetical protein
VQFGLQFEIAAEAKPLAKDASQDTDASAVTKASPGAPAGARPVPRGAASEPEETRPARSSVPASRKATPPAPVTPEPAPPADKPSGAEVVRLDKFRKK